LLSPFLKRTDEIFDAILPKILSIFNYYFTPAVTLLMLWRARGSGAPPVADDL